MQIDRCFLLDKRTAFSLPVAGAGVLLLVSLLFAYSCAERKHTETSVESWTHSHMDDADFLPRVRHLMDSLAFSSSPYEFESQVRKIADVLSKEGREGLAISVAAWFHELDLPADGNSLIGRRLLTQLCLPGNPAPALPLEDRNEKAGKAKGTIVLFFESGCHNCHAVINELKAAHDSLQTSGVRIVSIASDSERDAYTAYASGLPWDDKYCDYQSFTGVYFSAWGVASTPTMYYVDGQGTVEGRYYSLEEYKRVKTK